MHFLQEMKVSALVQPSHLILLLHVALLPILLFLLLLLLLQEMKVSTLFWPLHLMPLLRVALLPILRLL